MRTFTLFLEQSSGYLNKKPSQHFSLRYFGHQMSSFLSVTEGYKEQTILAEMAQFEWLLREAFDAADKSYLNMEELQKIAPERWPELKFDFHPTVNRVDLRFNIPQLWQAIDNPKKRSSPCNDIISSTKLLIIELFFSRLE
ncbi:MAG: hypothetical protein KZQ56_12985, partial [gamma proteobacterium symbiont of Lucinoma myriamae]|nr:hypothetical protein [gamma proteobacterium symbiont of Lucinoma myriamae]